jgi:origin recognition complex subunit 5
LTTLFILTYSAPGTLHKPGVPHINFTPYTREESIQILSRRPPHIFPDGPDPDDIFVWTRFLAVVWDTLAKSAARDLVSFRDAALGLWEEFVEPIVEGIWGTRDFSKLLVEQKSVFQREAVLVEGVVSRAPRQEKRTVHELPYYSKFLLISAYLASHNPARLDAVFFMHSSSSKKRRRGGLAATMPERLRGKRGRKILRNHLPAAPFALERMFAIFHSILPDSIGPATVDLGTQLATLGSLRLIVKTSSAADVLEKGTKWRVNVTWEFIRTMARGVGFEIEDRVSE